MADGDRGLEAEERKTKNIIQFINFLTSNLQNLTADIHPLLSLRWHVVLHIHLRPIA